VFKEQTVGGSTGCNRFTASYTVDGDRLELGRIATTQMACPPPADAVERAYLAALARVARWRADGSELVLLDDDEAELLRYRAATPIGEWEATAFLTGNAVASPLPGTTITATFAEGGELSGSSGCNRYTATFTTDGGRIEISPPASSRKLCSEPTGVMEQEAAYLAALPSAVEYRVDGDSLALLTADGTYVASFTRKTAR
jgi:heat shock protein HslJ